MKSPAVLAAVDHPLRVGAGSCCNLTGEDIFARRRRQFGRVLLGHQGRHCCSRARSLGCVVSAGVSNVSAWCWGSPMASWYHNGEISLGIRLSARPNAISIPVFGIWTVPRRSHPLRRGCSTFHNISLLGILQAAFSHPGRAFLRVASRAGGKQNTY